MTQNQGLKRRDAEELPELCTIEELAAEYKVPITFFYVAERRKGPGAIPCIRVGRWLRFNRREVREYFIRTTKEREQAKK